MLEPSTMSPPGTSTSSRRYPTRFAPAPFASGVPAVRNLEVISGGVPSWSKSQEGNAYGATCCSSGSVRFLHGRDKRHSYWCCALRPHMVCAGRLSQHQKHDEQACRNSSHSTHLSLLFRRKRRSPPLGGADAEPVDDDARLAPQRHAADLNGPNK